MFEDSWPIVSNIRFLSLMTSIDRDLLERHLTETRQAATPTVLSKIKKYHNTDGSVAVLKYLGQSECFPILAGLCYC